MTIQEGVDYLQGDKIEIPTVSRVDLPKFLVDQGYKVGAEIGVYKGRFTRLFLEAGLKMYGVDPYMAYDDYDMPNREFQKRQDYLAWRVQKELREFPDFTLVRKTSMEAIKDFKRGDLDFVYIDGHHGFKYIAEDLWEWSKIVKDGGIISGHDYNHANKGAKDPTILHPKFVIDAYTAARKIKPLYIVGTQAEADGLGRGDTAYDRWRSWFFFNKWEYLKA